ncbi:MAG: hypothetical protein A2068_11255 [Ignavibacteria bacterium GWB2_35_6b]|nr:MAG: hypothetical protein A2068_11255 [Ignavibacteria bacterium GWB2_35_6b]
MKSLFLVLIFLTLTFCKDEAVEPEELPGSLTISFDKTNIPDNIVSVKATVTRNGFETIIEDLNLLSETTAEIQIEELVAGTWHIKIEALDNNDKALYAGESDIEIKPGEITPISINLTPVLENLGGLFINVNWDDLPYNWFDQPTNPILQKDGSQFDNLGVWQPSIIKEETGYKMWYAGVIPGGINYTFYATSNDGLNWTKYSSQPILFPGANGTWDSQHVSPAFVMKESGQYYMYYVGWSDQGSDWGVGLATSQDGINWTKRISPVISGLDWDNQIVVNSILKINSIYYMYYSGRASTNATWKIGLATSADGINWTKHYSNPILESTYTWENNGVSYPTIILEDNLYKMIYSGGSSPAFGLAYSADGINWVKRLKEPFLTAELTYNNSRIAYPKIIVTEDEYRLYYSGFDSNNISFICVARKIITN